ncbi:Peroxyureidoacrylate/ureidoacrylate amidohydrolase RutB [Paraburkholderia hiiakae]|uniref:Peroxyureidoacrylate/ureidoacrylate amidohydrolase RutB n=1 Tax=Paraburkholderia hiiakae TaxID=1081782 RepID=A0ABN7I3E4_9BURK|nr:cysteine hydrolase [Paraburkholderia hiiakae]CAD6543218.1 Peroxyureidoacrylate/ureidoacrylate amidohydrolase RutB [Paraburkholderia hiiakae]
MKDAIYLVLDMENDLVHADGPNGKAGYAEQVNGRRIIENTRRAVDKARAAGVAVGFVRVGFSPDYRECPPDSPIFSGARKNGIFKLGTWGTEVHPDLGQQSGDFDIVKHRVSPFYATSLEAILRARGIRRIYCSGISTNAVVQASVREGHDRDYPMTVLEDCCCAITADEHENAIAGLRRFCTLSTSRDVTFE